MNLLLDTHIFLWYISQDNRLSSQQISAIQNPENAVYLSVISIWEVAIKHQLGKLQLPSPVANFLSTQRNAHHILSLSLGESSIQHLATLDQHHRDPFDRMLICQALEHGLTIVTVDHVFSAYNVPLL